MSSFFRITLCPPQVLLKRHRYNDITTILTNKTTVELSLSSNDNYLIQIKAMSEGGEGVGSEPIHIHKLSEFPVVFPSAYRFRSERMKLE